MSKTTPSIGLVGIDSIRIGGMKIADLPIGEQARTRKQIPLSIDTERQNKINNIMAGSPTQRVSYLKSRIAECRENIDRMRQLKVANQGKIDEYNTAINMCDFREKEIAQIADDNPLRDKIIKDLMKRFPPYNVERCKLQIEQFKESIERADEVIQNENDSIAQMTGLLALCQARDDKLRALGARIEAG